MPCSSALSIRAWAAGRFSGAAAFTAPRAILLTVRPVRPRRVYSIAHCSFILARARQAGRCQRLPAGF